MDNEEKYCEIPESVEKVLYPGFKFIYNTKLFAFRKQSSPSTCFSVRADFFFSSVE
jgi:hypothetical protein